MKFYITVKPDLQEVVNGLNGVYRAARRAGMTNLVTHIESLAVRNAPVVTSNLANSGTSEVNTEGTQGIIRFTAPYAKYVHDGTGIYGPHKTPIVPTTKKALFWPGANHPMRSVKGMKGRPFLLDALKASDIDGLYDAGIRNYLEQNGGITHG